MGVEYIPNMKSDINLFTPNGLEGCRRIVERLHQGGAKAGAQLYFKMVVETMKKEHLSIYAAMQEFGINDHKIIERWERIYLEEGPEGLSVERRGRSSTGRSKKLPKEVEEDLLAEVQRLRAENDYLKNLQALVLEDERRQHKKRW